MFALTNPQKRHLKALAHHRKPVVIVGDSGIGAGKAGLAPVSSEPNRAVTASRGGFGARSGSRTTVGG